MTSSPSASSPLPSRFTIYDSDLSSSYSDSEIDVDEWVSVSSSTTTSTTSSLPQHLNLSLKPKADLLRPLNGLPFHGCSISARPAFVKSSNIGVSKRLPETQQPGLPLKKLLPSLSTVYIVNPERLPRPAWSITKSYGTKLVMGGGEPQLRCQSPIELFHDSQYVRICARCAKPKMIISCDGTWKMDGGGICDLHTPYIRAPTNEHDGHREGIGKSLNVELIGAVLEAVQPFGRSETMKLGIQIFDMSIPSDSTEYVHRRGCRH